MIEILPENLANHVEKKCGSLAGELIPRPPIRLILRCWGKSSILCQQNSDAL